MTSQSGSPAAGGFIRLANTDTINFRNHANNGDVTIGIGSSNELQVNGVDVVQSYAKAKYHASGALTFANGTTPILVQYNSSDYDTQSAVTTGASWKFTVPTGGAGVYEVNACLTPNGAITFSSGSTALTVEVNGSAVGTLWKSLATVPSTTTICGSDAFNLNAGDTIQVFFVQSASGSVSTTASAQENYVYITRLP